MKSFLISIAVAATLALGLAGTASAQSINFGAGLIGFDGSGTFSATFAEGFQTGGGQSFGITESFADAESEFSVGLGGISAELSGSSGSFSQSGSLVNGNGAAWNVTGGVGFSASGLGAIGGGGVSF